MKGSCLEAYWSTPTFNERVSKAIKKYPFHKKSISLLASGNEPHVLNSKCGSSITLVIQPICWHWLQRGDVLLRRRTTALHSMRRRTCFISHQSTMWQVPHWRMRGYLAGASLSQPLWCGVCQDLAAQCDRIINILALLVLLLKPVLVTDTAFFAALSASSPLPIVGLISCPTFLCLDCLAEGISLSLLNKQVSAACWFVFYLFLTQGCRAPISGKFQVVSGSSWFVQLNFPFLEWVPPELIENPLDHKNNAASLEKLAFKENFVCLHIW